MMSTINTNPSILTPIYDSTNICMHSEYVGSRPYILWAEKQTDTPSKTLDYIIEYMGYLNEKDRDVKSSPSQISLEELKKKGKNKIPWPNRQISGKFYFPVNSKRKK